MLRQRRRLPVLCAALLLSSSFASLASAQNSFSSGSEHGAGYRFEVATVKPIDLKSHEIIPTGTDIETGGIVRLHGLPLKAMIAEAFNVQYWQIEGGEPWMEKDKYDVVGKPPDEIARTMPDTRHTWYTINDPRLREMLQDLLIQRFALKVHQITQTGKVYLLERTGNSLRLTPNKTDSAQQPSSGGRFGSVGFAGGWTLDGVTMPQLAQFASAYVLHRPVLDHCGLTGSFDYRSEPEDWATYQADSSGSFIRLLEQVGLKLEPSTGEVEMLVIDHADPPSPN